MKQLPQLVTENGRPRMLVDGRPFLILGLQWDCDSCFSPEEMNPLFPHAAKMGANTATLPTYWREIEPEPGKYDFTMIDERISVARENGMRIIPLWFATWKNATDFYAPDYIKNDPQTYRHALDKNGSPVISPCPTCEVTWERDRAALTAMMNHIRAVDDERTVIMVQVENEAGLLYTDRCYCPECTARFEAGDWKEKWGADAAEAFTVSCVSSYIDRLAGEAKAVYNLPMYVNVWMAPKVGGTPGDWPSGGGVQHMLAHYRANLKNIDMVSPDIYSHNFRAFNELCKLYGDGQPLYIAEASSSLTGRAERNVFYAIGMHNAIGFDPWAIDSPFPERNGEPLVDPLDGHWGKQAHWLRDSYVPIARAMEMVAEAQGTERMFTFVQEPGEYGASWSADGCDVHISYKDRDEAARGMVIQTGPKEFIVLGVGFQLQLRAPRPENRPVKIQKAEWGFFEGTTWKTLHLMRIERPASAGLPVSFWEPGVARLTLA